MTTTAEATAAPIPVKLGKKTYLISPLRDMDYGFLEKFAQDRYMDLAIRNAEKIEDKEAKQALINRAFDTASRVTFTSPEGIRQLNSGQGMVMLCWVSLRKEHPDLSIDDVAELLVKSGTDAQLLTKTIERQSKKKRKWSREGSTKESQQSGGRRNSLPVTC